MPYPTTYTWPITQPTASAPPVLPNPGPPVAGVATSEDPRKTQFERGIKWANVPGGKADNVIHGGERVYHVNSVQNVFLPPVADLPDRTNGLVAFRNAARYTPTPASVLGFDRRSSDRFGNPVFPFTGRYTGSQGLPVFDAGFWNVQSTVPLARYRYMGDNNPLFVQSGTVWIAGGLDSTGTPVSGAAVFNTGTNAWAVLPDMPQPKSDGFGVTLSMGDILVHGGSGSIGAEASASYRYSTGSNSWAILSPTITAHKHHRMVKILDGRVFLPGGTGLSGSGLVPYTGSELFEPDTNTWFANSASLPPIPIYPYDREGYTLDLLQDGSVLLTGGRDSRNGEANSHVLRFFPFNKGNNSQNPYFPRLTGSWTIEPSMSFVRSDHRTVVLDDGRVLIMGGNGGTAPNLKSFLPMYMGGQFGGPQAISDVELYDPVARTVTKIGQMRDARANFSAKLLSKDSSEGRVLVIGGENINTILSGTEICDIETFSWFRSTPLQVAVSQMRGFQISSGSSSPYRFIIPSGLLTGSVNAFTASQVFQTNG